MLSKPNQANGRANVGRVDHIALLYRDRAGQEKARQQFTELLGVDDWVDYGEIPEGVRPVISWKSGLELIYPTKDIPIFAQHLAKHGEGFFSMIFGVADLDQAMAHITQCGRTIRPSGPVPKGVLDQFEVAREAIVGVVGEINVTLGEFKPIG